MAKFKTGQSGNPAGRPKGSGMAGEWRKAIAENMPEIIAMLTERAKAGDMLATRMLLDRVFPALKPVAMPADVPQQFGSMAPAERRIAVLEAIAAGLIDAGSANELLGVVKMLERDIRMHSNRW